MDFFKAYEELKKQQKQAHIKEVNLFSLDTTDDLVEKTTGYMQVMRDANILYNQTGFINSFQPLDGIEPEARNPHRLSAGGLLTPGMNILAGDPKVGKTTFLAQLILSIASGRPIMDLFDVVPMKCGLIELEESKDKLSRMIRDVAPILGMTAQEYIDIARERIFITDQSVQSHDQLCSELYQMHLRGIKVIFIDTLGKLKESMQVSSNAYKQEAFLYGTVDRVAAGLDIALVYLHHTNKASQRQVSATQRVNGSNALIGAAQNIITLERKIRKSGDIFYMVYEGRANNPFAAEIERSKDSKKYWSFRPEAAVAIITTVQEWIRDVVLEKGQDGADVLDIQRALGIFDMSLINNQFFSMLERTELYIGQNGKFFYSPLWEQEYKRKDDVLPKVTL